MHIDLLRGKNGSLGLLADEQFDEAISGVIFDEDLSQLTLEFGETMDSLPLNIPVAYDFVQDVLRENQLHMGTVQKKHITTAAIIPLISGEFAEFGMPAGRHMPIFAFQSFMNRVESGQAIHRDDGFTEQSSGSVTGGVSPATIHLAPQLQQALQLEHSQGMQHAPTFAPPTMSPGGSSMPGMSLDLGQRQPKPPTSGKSSD